MAFFDTKAPQYNLGGLTGLVDRASQSPLNAIGNTMSELDAIATQRGKEQYSSAMSEKMKGIKSIEDYMNLGVDASRGTDAFNKQFQAQGTQLANLQRLQQQQKEQDLRFGSDIQRANASTIMGGMRQDPTQFKSLDALQAIKTEYSDNPSVVTTIDKIIEQRQNEQKALGQDKPSKPQFAVDVSNYMQKQSQGLELTPEEKIDLKIKKSYVDSEGDVDREIIDKSRASTEKHYGKLFDPNNKISAADVLDIKTYEKKIGFKPDAKANKDVKDSFVVLQAHKEVDEMLSTIGEEELSKGIIDRGEGWFDGMLSDKSFGELDEDTKKKRLLSVMADTKIGSFLAKYIKSISGTAVAEKEYDRLAGVLKGGDDFKNIQTLRQSFSTFGIDLNRDFRNTLSSSYLDNTGTVLDLSRKYNSGVSDYYEKRKKETYEATGKTGNIKYDKYLMQQEANK